MLFLNKTVGMKGRKGQPSLQDLRDYYKRQQYLEHFEEELCLSRRKKTQLTASGLQREDERPQNEPDLRSVHYIRASHRRHLLASSSSAYDQKQSMILFHSIQQSLVETSNLVGVTTQERVTRRLIANREGELYTSKKRIIVRFMRKCY